MFKDFGFPTNYQLKRLAIHAFGAFLGGAGAYLTAAGATLGEPSSLATVDTIVAMLLGSLSAGIVSVYNFVLYTFEKSQK